MRDLWDPRYGVLIMQFVQRMVRRLDACNKVFKALYIYLVSWFLTWDGSFLDFVVDMVSFFSMDFFHFCFIV